MSVEKDESGRRTVEASIEVDRTPEQVWDTIATGAGMAARFMPMDMPEGEEVGDVTCDTPGGMQVIGKITAWEPPDHIVGEAGRGPASCSCTSSMFHGRRAGYVAALRFVDPSVAEAWAVLTSALGVQRGAAGEAWTAPQGAPSLTGTVAETLAAETPSGMIRVDGPMPGALLPFAVDMGGQGAAQRLRAWRRGRGGPRPRHAAVAGVARRRLRAGHGVAGMRSAVILCVLLGLGCASPSPGRPPPAELPPGFELPEPHDYLERFVGSWTVESEVPSEEGDVGMKGGAVAREVGSWVLIEGTAEVGGVTLQAYMAIGYDPTQERFVAVWFDSMMPFLRTYEGRLDAAGEVLTLDGRGTSAMDPTTRIHYRERLSFLGDDRRLHESFVSPDGTTWTQTVSARSRRQQAADR